MPPPTGLWMPARRAGAAPARKRPIKCLILSMGSYSMAADGRRMAVILFGRAAQFLLALAMMRVATTLLSPEEMGRMSLVTTTTAFFALFLINPVGMFINRRLHAWQSSGLARHYLTCYAGYLI